MTKTPRRYATARREWRRVAQTLHMAVFTYPLVAFWGRGWWPVLGALYLTAVLSLTMGSAIAHLLVLSDLWRAARRQPFLYMPTLLDLVRRDGRRDAPGWVKVLPPNPIAVVAEMLSGLVLLTSENAIAAFRAEEANANERAKRRRAESFPPVRSTVIDEVRHVEQRIRRREALCV